MKVHLEFFFLLRLYSADVILLNNVKILIRLSLPLICHRIWTGFIRRVLAASILRIYIHYPDLNKLNDRVNLSRCKWHHWLPNWNCLQNYLEWEITQNVLNPSSASRIILNNALYISNLREINHGSSRFHFLQTLTFIRNSGTCAT